MILSISPNRPCDYESLLSALHHKLDLIDQLLTSNYADGSLGTWPFKYLSLNFLDQKLSTTMSYTCTDF